MIELGGKQYVVPQPGGMRTFAFQQRILPVVGRVANVFIPLLGLEGGLSGLAEKDVTDVLPVALPRLGEIFSSMPPGELEAIARILLGDPKFGAQPGETATCGKVPLFGSPGGDAFDSLMKGRTADVWKLLWHAIQVWYPDFFSLARSSLAREQGEKVSKGSTTSPTSGQGTDSSSQGGSRSTDSPG